MSINHFKEIPNSCSESEIIDTSLDSLLDSNDTNHLSILDNKEIIDYNRNNSTPKKNINMINCSCSNCNKISYSDKIDYSENLLCYFKKPLSMSSSIKNYQFSQCDNLQSTKSTTYNNCVCSSSKLGLQCTESTIYNNCNCSVCVKHGTSNSESSKYETIDLVQYSEIKEDISQILKMINFINEDIKKIKENNKIQIIKETDNELENEQNNSEIKVEINKSICKYINNKINEKIDLFLNSTDKRLDNIEKTINNLKKTIFKN